MIINLNKNLRVISDERQYILQERKKALKTNKDTMQKEEVRVWTNIGYYGLLNYLMRAIPEKIIRKNDDINCIKLKLDEILKNMDIIDQAYKEDIKCLKEDKRNLNDKIKDLNKEISDLKKGK